MCGNGECRSDSDILTHISDSGAVTLIGLAPDGNSAVSVDRTNGAVTVAPVIDNVYAVGGPSSVAGAKVLVRDASGRVREYGP